MLCRFHLVDSVQIDEKRGTGTYGGLSSLPSTADIGNNGSSSKQSFHGLMGDVQLYDKSLSVAEIQELYQDAVN